MGKVRMWEGKAPLWKGEWVTEVSLHKVRVIRWEIYQGVGCRYCQGKAEVLAAGSRVLVEV